jgi:hypothetical protein
MKAMKKFESFLCDFSWKIRLAIFLAFILWVPQTFFPIVNHIKNNYHPDVVEAVVQSSVEELRWNNEIRDFSRGMVKAAEKKGNAYSPDDYFRDYRKIKDFKKKYPPFRYHVPFDVIHTLNGLLHENLRNRLYSMRELDLARYKYGFDKNNPDAPAPKISAKNLIRESGIIEWSLMLYWRGLLMAMLLYFVRMAQERGLIETILADKKKLLLAIILWPKFLFAYPNNVARQIVVEAELRRLGSFWRKLDPREKMLVKQIANRSKAEYQRWIKDYEIKNAQCFKRSFEWALAATILIILSQAALPVNASADMAKLRDGPCLEQGAVYDQYDTRSEDESNSVSPDNVPAWVEEIVILPGLYFIKRLEIIFEKLRIREFSRSVFKIPVDGYLVKGFLLQTK